MVEVVRAIAEFSVRRWGLILTLHLLSLVAVLGWVGRVLSREAIEAARTVDPAATVRDLTEPGPARYAAADAVLLRLFDNAPAYTMGEGSSELAWYSSFKAEWPPPDEMFLVDVRPPNGAPVPEQLERLRAFERGLYRARHPDVSGVFWAGSVPGLPMTALASGEPGLLARVPEVLARDPSAVLTWSANPRPAWGLYAFVNPSIGDSDLRRLDVEAHLSELAARTFGEGALDDRPNPEQWRVVVLGTGSATGAMLHAVAESITVDFVIVNVVILGLLLMIFRNPRTVAIAIVCILQGEALTILAMLGWRGGVPEGDSLASRAASPFDWITANLGSSVFLMGIAGSVHLMHTYLLARQRGDDAPTAVMDALQKEFKPYFWTMFTTWVSLLGLSETSAVASVCRYGRFAAVGLAVGMLCNLTLLPALLARFDRKADHVVHGHRLAELVTRASAWAWRNPGLTLTLAAVATILGTWATITQARFDGNILEYFPHGLESRIAERADRIEERWGVIPYYVELRRPDGQSWLAPDHVRDLAAFTDGLRTDAALNEVAPTRAALSLADAARGACVSDAEQVTCDAGWPATDELSDVVLGTPLGVLFTPNDRSEPGDRTRVLVVTDPLWASVHTRLETALSRIAASTLPGLVDAKGEPKCISGLTAPHGTPTLGNTGMFVLFGAGAESRDPCVPSIKMQGQIRNWMSMELSILDGYVRSLIFSIAPNVAVLIFIFRRRNLSLLSVLPNLTPFMVAIGFVGLLTPAIPSPAAFAVTIAAGVIADDTTFYLMHLRDRLVDGHAELATIREMVREAAIPVVATNLALMLGFATLLRADLRPVAYLGALIALTVGVGLLCDLLLLPAALGLLKRLNIRVDA